jgi:hypothetical protein
VGLCILLRLLGNGSAETLLRQREIVESVVLYAVRVASRERKRYKVVSVPNQLSKVGNFFLSSTSCLNFETSLPT